jgi:hypothetical protein
MVCSPGDRMLHHLRILASLVAALVLVSPVAVSPAAAKKLPRTLKLRFPRTVIPAGGNVEDCVFLRVPVREAFDLASYQITQRGFSGTGAAINHFLIYLYAGERLGEFAMQQKDVVESRGCLDLGPADRDARQVIALSRAPNNRAVLPPGLALPLEPTPAAPGGPPDGIGILFDANWINSATKPRAVSARVVLTRAKPGTVRRRLQPIFARDSDAGIDVPPFALRATESLVDARWRPPVDACLFDVTGKTHRRGRFFAVELRDAADQPRAPLDGLPNPYADSRPTLFGAPDYTDPGTRRFDSGLFVGAAESLRYGCWHDNGEMEPARLGCQETSGVTPGSVGAPAAECSPGCTCVPANLVAGPTPDDEICALAGFYYDAAPGGSCDVSALPPVN